MKDKLARADAGLRQVQQVLSNGSKHLSGEEWLLVATNLVEAWRTHREAADGREPVDPALLCAVLADVRQSTGGFTDPHFLRSTKAARRRGPELFKPPLTSPADALLRRR